jgi:hypothetical protein
MKILDAANWKNVTNKKLSVCPCGFPLLDESIPLGTEYRVLVDSEQGGKVICGGCGHTIQVTLIYVAKRGSARAGFMPKEIFEPLEP